MSTAYLNIGTNLGDKHANIERAICAIENNLNVRCRRSLIMESDAWGFESQNRFLNIAIAVEITCSPIELLQKVKSIEQELGTAGHRNADGSYADRLIDIDIMVIDDIVMETPQLTLPHPHIEDRVFFLTPLKELYPDWKK